MSSTTHGSGLNDCLFGRISPTAPGPTRGHGRGSGIPAPRQADLRAGPGTDIRCWRAAMSILGSSWGTCRWRVLHGSGSGRQGAGRTSSRTRSMPMERGCGSPLLRPANDWFWFFYTSLRSKKRSSSARISGDLTKVSGVSSRSCGTTPPGRPRCTWTGSPGSGA